MTLAYTTPEPFRLKVLKAICASFEQIESGTDYNFTLKDRVFRGRNKFGTNDPIPLISIIEPPVAPDELPVPGPTGLFKGDWNLLVQAFLPDDRDNPTDPGYYILTDIKRKIGIEKSRFIAGAPEQSSRFRNPFSMGKHRDGIGSERKANYVEDVRFGLGVVRPADEAISDKAYFWLPLTLQIVEDTVNPFV